ncbi:hypothetical protein [Shimia marina]|uniref:hypothetical protein n=1 Tax=Shimia marina TaxID=321267 RepID=UPI00122C9AD6|nr:hypothetical protein [Shimia marina]
MTKVIRLGVLLSLSCLVLAACLGGGTPQSPPTQPAPEVLADPFSFWTRAGNVPFRLKDGSRAGSVGVSVRATDASKDLKRIYYTVELDHYGGIAVARENKILPAYLSAIPDSLVSHAHYNILIERADESLLLLATAVSQVTICVDGQVQVDDRNRQRASLSAEQSARVVEVSGGNLDAILGLSNAELKRAGYGDLLSEAEDIPVINFRRYQKGYVDIYLMCQLG